MTKFSVGRFLSEQLFRRMLALAVYPLTALVTTPWQLARTVAGLGTLRRSARGQYNRFTPGNALNSLFYWSASVVLRRFGRRGICPYIGTGNYPLTRWFFFPQGAIHLYRLLTPLMPVISISVWALSCCLWAGVSGLPYVLAVTGLLICSTTFFAHAFVLQNYNALGWVFMPAGLFGVMTGCYPVAGAAWLLASFGSPTVVFLGCLFSAGAAVIQKSCLPCLVLVPACMKLAGHVAVMMGSGKLGTDIINIAKYLGLTGNRVVRYKHARRKVLSLRNVYYLLLYVSYLILQYLLTGTVSPYMAVATGIYVLYIIRMHIGDAHHIHLFVVTVAAADVLLQNNWVMLAPLWLAASPLPAMLGILHKETVFTVVPVLRPFCIGEYVEGMENFLRPVTKGERLLMAFDDPRGVYEDLYDGYRTMLELPLYVAARKEVHMLTSLWSIYELNYEGAPDFWGRDVVSVNKNVRQWNARFVIVYQDSGTVLDGCWERAGYRVHGMYSWKNYEKEFGEMRPYTGPTPDWWLLEAPENLLAEAAE